ncbi:MAG: LCP family protein [Anaerolineae bacterium]|nr:LCP family protein [Anaerolineae bacterium]
MTQNRVRPLSRLGCVANLLFFRIVPFLLIVAIVWTAAQVFSSQNDQSAQASSIDARRADYAATATALSVPVEDVRRQDGFQLVQFVTNTPSGSDEEAPTETPAAVQEVLPTPTPVDGNIQVDLPDFFVPPNAQEGQVISGTLVPTQVPLIPRDYNLVNILLLGGDDSLFQDGSIRTDVMIVASLNLDTRTVSLLNLPRDLFVYVPTPTMARLNTVYGIGEAFGWTDGGFGLLAQTIFYNLGIRVHYYARVNFDGFVDIIDTLGGVDMAVDCAYQDYALIDTEIPEGAYLADEEAGLWTLPVGYYRMSGREALWYVRTRNSSRDEFDRGRRQQQLLRAILRETLDSGTLQQVPTLWDQVTQVVDTNIPLDVMLSILPIAFELDPARIKSYTMIRTYHTTPWQPPEGPYAGQAVQLPNYQPIHDLLYDFYQPPTSTRLSLSQASIAVYNGTDKPDLDLVAVQRLREEGFNAVAYGPSDATDYADSVIIDQIGDEKGSLNVDIGHVLNITPENMLIQLDPSRQADYRVIIGSNYNSCSANVVPVE